MASTNTIYANIYYNLKISEHFHHRFILLPYNMPAGEYTYAVWLEERKSWLDKSIWWCSKLINKNNEIIHKNEICVTSDGFYSRKLAFIAELVNFAYKYDMWEDGNYFCSHNQEFRLRKFELDDTLENSDFEVEVGFDTICFDWCLETFKSFGIDTNKYDTYYRYNWIITKSSAKLYYDKQCIYSHPDPKKVLAHLGWFLAPKAQ